MPETKTSNHVSQVGAVFSIVTDVDKAIEFWTTKLGFEVKADVPFGEGDRWVEVGPADGQSTIALNLPRGDSKPGAMLCAFLTDDIDVSYKDMKEKGVDVDAEIMRGGDPVPPMFFFRDQDGNSFLIVQPGN